MRLLTLAMHNTLILTTKHARNSLESSDSQLFTHVRIREINRPISNVRNMPLQENEIENFKSFTFPRKCSDFE